MNRKREKEEGEEAGKGNTEGRSRGLAEKWVEIEGGTEWEKEEDSRRKGRGKGGEISGGKR